MAEKPVIIKRVESDDHDAHHGGSWKVAYADFMTAMMAFFLLLWIVSAADADKLKGLAEYFTPVMAQSNGGGPELLDGQIVSNDQLRVGGVPSSEEMPPIPAFGQENPLMVFDSRLRYDDATAAGGPGDSTGEASAEGPAAEGRETAPGAGETGTQSASAEGMDDEAIAVTPTPEEERAAEFEALQAQISEQLRASGLPEEFLGNIRFSQSADGVDVHIVDQPGRSMFASGSARISAETRMLIESVSAVLTELPNKILISGHTDAVPFTTEGYDNWDLSAERANATRRVLLAGGVQPARIARVAGLADTVPLLPEAPDSPENRRVSIKLLYPSGVESPI